jgi:hypothetical protein
VDADLDTLATALYVAIDDLLTTSPDRAAWRPGVGIPLQLSDVGWRASRLQHRSRPFAG